MEHHLTLFFTSVLLFVKLFFFFYRVEREKTQAAEQAKVSLVQLRNLHA